MERTTERQEQQVHHAQDGSEAELSTTFCEWTQTMSAQQIRHLLAQGSAEGLAEYSRQNELLGHDSHRTWRLLKAELVNRLQALTAPAAPDESVIVRHWADALTPEESSAVLAHGSLESFNAYLRARQLPTPSDLPRMWALLEIELKARTEHMNASHGTMGTA